MLSLFRKLFCIDAPPTSDLMPLMPLPGIGLVPVLAPASTDVISNVGPTIAIVNNCSVLTNDQIAAVIPDLQIQIDRDFAPVWKIRANLVFVPKGMTYPTDAWVIYILDNSDQAGALGYHDLTDAGMPTGKIFAKDDMTYNLSWTVTLSHELVEVLLDPYITYTVFNQDSNTTGTLYALEGADACENESFAYRINNTLVSDFVYPAWFEGFRAPNSTQFDHTSALTAPFQLAKGGYIGVFTVGPSSTGWTQRMAEGIPSRRLIRKGAYSRTNRRGKPLV